MKYITNRLAIDAFEYDPYGEKPEWFMNMVTIGKAFEYKKKNTAEIKSGIEWRKFKTGDRVFLDENGQIGIIPSSLFSSFCKPLDNTKDASSMFNEKINDAVYNHISNNKTSNN